MVSVYHTLFNIITGLKEMEEDQFEQVSDKLQKGFYQFVHLQGQSGEVPPTTLPALITILHKDASEWGIEGVEEYFPLDKPLLDSDTGLSFEAEEFLEVIENPEEYEQGVMKKILIYCRENNLQEEYTRIRTFLSDPNHAVITKKRLFIFLAQVTHDELRKHLESCYERITNIGHYKVCPYCKWTLEEGAGKWHCNDGSTCHLQSEFINFSNFEESKEQYLRMKRGIHRYTLLPGIAESKIAENLEKRGYKISMYPGIDEADILVEKDGNKLVLDVKDYYSPFYFAKHISQQYTKGDVEGVFFVIPQARLDIFPSYIDQAKNYYAKSINLLSENELYRRVGDLLG